MIAIFNLDGTLALNEHRQHFLKETPKNWKGFEAACGDDEPNIPLTNFIVDRIWHDEPFCIISGRSDAVKYKTIEWLYKNINSYEWENVLWMRRDGDYREDQEVKKEMLDAAILDFIKDGHLDKPEDARRLFLIFDDRQKVVDMWREMGFVCCQVAPGYF